MQLVRNLARGVPVDRPAVATLGIFDGVHLAHRRILEAVVLEAHERDAIPTALTFAPHPAAILAPGREPQPIASLRERLARFRDLGIERTVLRRFDRAFSRVSAEAFVEDTLVRGLAVTHVVVGHKVSFGRDRGGDASSLRELGDRHGFSVEVVGPVEVEGVVVGSTGIRERLQAADLEGAAALLGRSYGIRGRVVVGKRRGAALGFPTANVHPWVAPLVPDGVYAVRVELGERSVPGICNIGRNPTFADVDRRSVEAHLFDFEEDLYGQTLTVELVERIRAERRFPSPQALVAQIATDVERARTRLGVATS